jgi:hypothetical protein
MENQNPKRHIVLKEETYIIVFMVLTHFKQEARILSLRTTVTSRENSADFEIHTSKVQGAEVALSV